MNIVPFDIETLPKQPEEETRKAIAETIEAPAKMKKAETIADWHAGEGKYVGEKEAAIEKQYRDTSFDGSKGQICSISWAIGLDAEPESIFATPMIRTEADLLSNFFDRLREGLESRQPQPYFIGHFISGFDLPFLYQRAVVNKVNPGMKLGQWGRHEQQFFDNMNAWAGWKGNISQDNLCIALGIQIDEPEGIAGLDGSTVWDFYKDGKYQEIEKYNCVDVLKVQANYKRLTFT